MRAFKTTLLALAAMIAAWPMAASAQLSDTTAVSVSVGVAQPPPALTLDTVRDIDFGTVFRSRLSTGACLYTILSDGTIPAPADTNNRTALAGCGFRDAQVPLTGRVSFSCTPNALMSYTSSLTADGVQGILLKNQNLLLRDTKEVRVGTITPNGNLVCPAAGAGLIDVGVQVEVRDIAPIASATKVGRITLSATIS